MKKLFALLLVMILAGTLPCNIFAQENAASGNGEWFYAQYENGVPESLKDDSEWFYAADPEEGPVHLTVGNTTKVSGKFFTSYFGSNTSDIDVRNAIHGYSPTWWDNQIQFIADHNVVTDVEKTSGENGVTYTFTLQQDLTYNDGVTPITARDYVFSWLLTVSPQLAEIGAVAPDINILGYEAYHSGRSEVFSGIRLLGDYSFSMTIREDFGTYFYELSQFQMYPYPISVIAPGCGVADDGNGAYMTGPFTVDLLRETVLDPETGYLSHPALTAGPWKLTSYDPESGTVEFEINEFYKGNWEDQKPSIERLTLVPVYPENMIEQLQSGEVDVLNKCVDRKVIEAGLQLSGGDGFGMKNYPRIGYGFMAFSLEKKGPQQSQAVRQALAYAFDNDTFIREMLGGFAIPVYGYYGIGQWMVSAANGTYRPYDLTEEEEEAWDALTLDSLNHYDPDLEEAKRLLVEDGWTLNSEGQPFTDGTDSIRYKEVDGELMPLVLKFAKCARNDLAEKVVELFDETLPQIGAALDVEEVPFTELLSDYYREDGERRFDMNFMATNFVSVFDPYLHFSQNESLQGVVNNAGVADEELLAHAWDMRTTEPFDLLTFETHWLEMQKRFNEILPTMPLYSNVYFDFHTDWLQDYHPDAQYDWPVAMLYAFWGEPPEPEASEDEEEFEDGDFVIGDEMSPANFNIEDFYAQYNGPEAQAADSAEANEVTETPEPTEEESLKSEG